MNTQELLAAAAQAASTPSYYGVITLTGPDSDTWDAPASAIISHAHLVLTAHSTERPQASLLLEDVTVEWIDPEFGAVLALSAGGYTLRTQLDHGGQALRLCAQADCFDFPLGTNRALYCGTHIQRGLLGAAFTGLAEEMRRTDTHEAATITTARMLLTEDQTTALLDEHGIATPRARSIAATVPEPWNLTQVALHLGLDGEAARDTARRTMARAGVEPVSREPGQGGSNLYDPVAVRTVARPGRGARTDLHNT